MLRLYNLEQKMKIYNLALLFIICMCFNVISSVSEASECHSYEELKTALHEKFENRVTSFSLHIVYNFLFSDINNILQQAFEEIKAQDDYLAFSYRSMNVKCSGYDGDVTANYTMEYRTTYRQEESISQRVTEILDQIITNSMNDEEKEKAIHDWIVLNVQYDTARNNYSAYDALFYGKAVCQGYSLLTFKMLDQAGVPVRIIQGRANNEDHVWNMVYLCGAWYHLDVTWDDPIPDQAGRVLYNYFNKSDTEMQSGDKPHTWEVGNYPEASIVYQAGICSGLLSIHGRVITLLPGYQVGIKNAFVAIKNTEYSDITEQDGIFEIIDIPANNFYVMTISASKFETRTIDVKSQVPHFEIGDIELNLQKWDVNGDNRIGLEESIYALQVVCGIIQ